MKALDRIPQTDFKIQKHGGVDCHATMTSAEFFAMLTLAINYAHDKVEIIKKNGLNGMKITDPGLDNKVKKLRESYEYWNKEYERLITFANEVRR